jgi:hypothetical protein
MTQQRFQLEDHDSEIPTALTVVVKIKLKRATRIYETGARDTARRRSLQAVAEVKPKQWKSRLPATHAICWHCLPIF